MAGPFFNYPFNPESTIRSFEIDASIKLCYPIDKDLSRESM